MPQGARRCPWAPLCIRHTHAIHTSILYVLATHVHSYCVPAMHTGILRHTHEFLLCSCNTNRHLPCIRNTHYFLLCALNTHRHSLCIDNTHAFLLCFCNMHGHPPCICHTHASLLCFRNTHRHPSCIRNTYAFCCVSAMHTSALHVCTTRMHSCGVMRYTPVSLMRVSWLRFRTKNKESMLCEGCGPEKNKKLHDLH